MIRHAKTSFDGEPPKRRLNDNGEGMPMLVQGENALKGIRDYINRHRLYDDLALGWPAVKLMLTAIDYIEHGSREPEPWTVALTDQN